MTISSFEDLQIWRKAKELAIKTYKTTAHCKDYSFRDQIRRAAVSVSNNIAEGFERRGNKEYKYFLFISKGSCGEVRSMLYIGKELHYLSSNDFQNLIEQTLAVSKMISSLIKMIK